MAKRCYKCDALAKVGTPGPVTVKHGDISVEIDTDLPICTSCIVKELDAFTETHIRMPTQSNDRLSHRKKQRRRKRRG